MNELTTLLTQRELFLIGFGILAYVLLFVLTAQNSKRKLIAMQQRLDRVRQMQEEQQAKSQLSIEQNRRRVAELESLIARLGDENSMLRLQLEERKAQLDYANTMAIIDNEKRQQADTSIMSSDVYLKMKRLLAEGRPMGEEDWQRLTELVDGVYSGFTQKLYSLYKMSEQDFRVCVLIKVRVAPKDIALLTAHSKESVASTRSRLYHKVFGKKGTTREWDDFVLSL